MKDNKNKFNYNRIDKIKILNDNGIDPYPSECNNKKNNLEIKNSFNYIQHGDVVNKKVEIFGRIMRIRDMGKAMFLDVQDGYSKIQIYANKSIMQDYNLFKSIIDISDIVSILGVPFRTKTNEFSILVNTWRILTKSLLPLPEKWHGLRDIETRYRKRHLDLIMNSNVKHLFIKRSILINALRSKLIELGFIEVETPILQSIAGGANAKPFITHHNSLNEDLFLRISPELFLKRVIIGGIDKIFEIGKSFRNEGIDKTHNPEFTMLEIYQAYANYKDMMNLAEILIKTAAKAVNSNVNLVFREACMFDLIKQYTGVYLLPYIENKQELLKQISHLNLNISSNMTNKKLLEKIFDEKILPNLQSPFFITDYPAIYSPLAKKKQTNLKLAERFEIYINKLEIGNAYSELNDPIVQKTNFTEQVNNKSYSEDQIISSYDNDFISALEQGLPPTGGLGIGIDRLIMVLTETESIKDVILFPTLKSE
ncbi:MAG: lysine--tRNA ligase [Endomicrobium sp.]|jgi:lysyl-tRNA synthetase class 2|nr:lysine--tRNA ligase [Endomicrobium sp.]